MAEELVRLTSQNDEMEEKVKEIPKLKILLKVSCICRIAVTNVDWRWVIISSCNQVLCPVEVQSFCFFQDLEQRHNTILQMYGEKAEEAEELRLDLEDVKSMYKIQIDELLKNQKWIVDIELCCLLEHKQTN